MEHSIEFVPGHGSSQALELVFGLSVSLAICVITNRKNDLRSAVDKYRANEVHCDVGEMECAIFAKCETHHKQQTTKRI
jgi:hypothetical protein